MGTTVRLRSVHFFSLTFILATVFAYLNVKFLASDAADRAGFLIGCSLVAIFWWALLVQRTNNRRSPIAIFMYLTSTVLFAHLAPLAMLFNLIQMFEKVRPLPDKLPGLLILVAELVAYGSVFWTTRWFLAGDGSSIKEA